MLATNKKLVFDAVIETPFCHLGLLFKNKKLIATEYLPLDSKLSVPNLTEVRDVVDQIKSYIDNPLLKFDLPLNVKGTDFQQRVWRKLTEIPSGQVKTYGELAKELSSAAQAVGNACRANPVPLIVPCHRIVSAIGIGGFAGATSGYLIDIKRQILRHEGLEF